MRRSMSEAAAGQKKTTRGVRDMRPPDTRVTHARVTHARVVGHGPTKKGVQLTGWLAGWLVDSLALLVLSGSLYSFIVLAMVMRFASRLKPTWRKEAYSDDSK